MIVNFSQSFLTSTMGSVLVSFFFSAGTSKASAWVKGANQHYAKVGYSSSAVSEYRGSVSSNDIDETTSAISGYGEYGLPAPWSVQIGLSFANKSITRKSPEIKDEFKSQGMGDTEWMTKHKLFNSPNVFSSPISVLGAGYLGGVIPTTKKSYRVGQEDSRNPEVSSSRRFLISPIDDGVTKYSGGAVLTLVFQSIWLSYDRIGLINSGGDIVEERVSQEIGSGLPMNSWVQLSVSKSRKFSSKIGDIDIQASEFAQMGLSGGLTVYQNIAIELGVSSTENRAHGWKKNLVYSFGVSHRTL